MCKNVEQVRLALDTAVENIIAARDGLNELTDSYEAVLNAMLGAESNIDSAYIGVVGIKGGAFGHGARDVRDDEKGA